MKKNLPITNNEVTFADDEELISTTDLKGAITSYNDIFLRISGFTEDELKGVNHNIVRHPDMPEAAFADLWKHMKAKKHWMGIVKNRCKNGDYYWVDAYVTPIIESGQVIGYESVRVKPSAERIARADKIYKQLNAGQVAKLGSFSDRLAINTRAVIINFVAMISGIFAYAMTPEVFNYLPLTIGISIGMGVFILASSWAFSPLNKVLQSTQKNINNPLMALIYTGRSDDLGQIQLLNELLKAKLRTILSQLKDVAVKIERNADESADALDEINLSIQNQANETGLVATAMTEMTASVQEVACSAINAAEKADDADRYSQEGVQHASEAAVGLQGLTQAVQNVAQVVSKLDSNTQNIGSVLDVIRGIAEQTNLLALNAAIEAARAGEQGRGFAVVADEVRTLAGRTQESTQEIQQLIENLNSAVAQAVNVMGDSENSASSSEGQVTQAIDSLGSIAEQVSSMNDINMQIAAAVKQQSAVTEDINKNVVQISGGAENVLLSAGSVGSVVKALSQQAHDLKDTIQRFKQG